MTNPEQVIALILAGLCGDCRDDGERRDHADDAEHILTALREDFVIIPKSELPTRDELHELLAIYCTANGAARVAIERRWPRLVRSDDE